MFSVIYVRIYSAKPSEGSGIMKKKILETLKNNTENYVSGEELSNAIGVTRAAIWKHIKQLKDEGYEIEAISSKGYKLVGESEILDSKALEIEMKESKFVKKIIHFNTIDSTSSQAKQMASQGAAEGTIVISEEQTGGRGRLGRQWMSPKGTGIWMSIILKPHIEPQEATKITQVAAAAVALAIRDLTGCEPGIKWPNDIIVGEKKVCGILTEMSGELNSVSYVTVGIGINVNMSIGDFPEELLGTATSLKEFCGKSFSRKHLVINILREFEELYLDFTMNNNVKRSVSICRDLSVTLGNQVKIIQRGNEMLGKALDITEDGELIIKNSEGKIQNIMSGEVSVRGIKGYI